MAIEAGRTFRTVVADYLYGEHPAVQTALWDGVIPYVLGLRAHRGSWVPADDPHTPEDAARLVPWEAPAPRAAGPPWRGAAATGTARPGGRPTCAWSGWPGTRPSAWSP